MKTNFTFNHIGKALVICVSLVLFSNRTTAQITLSGVSGANLVSADTFIKAQNYQNFESMGMAKANGKWDVTSAEVGPLIYYYDRFEANNTNFPSASYEKVISYLFAGSMEYSTTTYMVADNSVVGVLGEEILESEVLSLATVTGNASDQLVFPKQVIHYNETEREQVFPMTYNDNFKNTEVLVEDGCKQDFVLNAAGIPATLFHHYNLYTILVFVVSGSSETSLAFR